MESQAQSSLDRQLVQGRLTPFDQVLANMTGLPDHKATKPTTIQAVIPLLGHVSSWIVQTVYSKDDGFTTFIQVVDAEGRERIVVPPKVMAALYRQRQSLLDRSTPESRRRKRASAERQKRKAEKEARRAAFSQRAAKNGD